MLESTVRLTLIFVDEHEKSAECRHRDIADGDGQWTELGPILSLGNGDPTSHDVLDEMVDERVLIEQGAVGTQADNNIVQKKVQRCLDSLKIFAAHPHQM